MRAMLLEKPGFPLQLVDREKPAPAQQEILIRVAVCGVCRTDLHVLDGELEQTEYPIIPGHQVVGIIEALGADVVGFEIGERVGVPWLGFSCGRCDHCQMERENLCPDARYTGCQIDGGFAEYCVANHRYCFRLPARYSDLQVAPLLCAGLIGYRAWRMCEPAAHVGFMGFGASAHILAQVARSQGASIYAFTRGGDLRAQQFALALGAVWAGSSEQSPDRELDAVIIFAPVGELVPRALALVRPGGKVVCAGIHMTDIPSFPYDLLWQERSICSVANLTRSDGIEFLALAKDVAIDTEVHAYPLEQANQALEDLKRGHFTGAAVIQVSSLTIG
jgi:propanol-preferring alcohol dehydrogenase